MIGWHHHPAVRSGGQLRFRERAADTMRRGMGSWTFVIAVMAFLVGYMASEGRHGFDPYPFILLNLILSCMAALQGSIILIAANRADQTSAEHAVHTEALISEVHAVVTREGTP